MPSDNNRNANLNKNKQNKIKSFITPPFSESNNSKFYYCNKKSNDIYANVVLNIYAEKEIACVSNACDTTPKIKFEQR